MPILNLYVKISDFVGCLYMYVFVYVCVLNVLDFVGLFCFSFFFVVVLAYLFSKREMKDMESDEWGYGKELGRAVKGETCSQNILDKN